MRRRADQLIPLEAAILEAATYLTRRGTPDFHGYALATRIRSVADRRALTAYGTLYRALHRLERAGLLEGFWEDPSRAEAGGRPRRRLYRITPQAAQALARARAEERTAERTRRLKTSVESAS